MRKHWLSASAVVFSCQRAWKLFQAAEFLCESRTSHLDVVQLCLGFHFPFFVLWNCNFLNRRDAGADELLVNDIGLSQLQRVRHCIVCACGQETGRDTQVKAVGASRDFADYQR